MLKLDDAEDGAYELIHNEYSTMVRSERALQYDLLNLQQAKRSIHYGRISDAEQSNVTHLFF